MLQPSPSRFVISCDYTLTPTPVYVHLITWLFLTFTHTLTHTSTPTHICPHWGAQGEHFVLCIPLKGGAGRGRLSPPQPTHASDVTSDPLTSRHMISPASVSRECTATRRHLASLVVGLSLDKTARVPSQYILAALVIDEDGDTVRQTTQPPGEPKRLHTQTLV